MTNMGASLIYCIKLKNIFLKKKRQDDCLETWYEILEYDQECSNYELGLTSIREGQVCFFCAFIYENAKT